MKNITIVALLFLTTITSAQRFKVLSGNLKNLKGISEYHLTFDYSGYNVVAGAEPAKISAIFTIEETNISTNPKA